MPVEHETDLYAPIKAHFERAGFRVAGEVKGCDVVGVKDGQITIVELKKAVTIDALLQAANRQELTPEVYIGVPAPGKHDRRWKGLCGLCRRLGIGLLAVDMVGRVQVFADPEPVPPREKPKKRARLLREFEGRSADFNVGGSTRTPLVTAYREQAIRLAMALRDVPAGRSPKDLKTETGVARAQSLLHLNHYGWFAKLAKGIYAISDAGREALRTWSAVVDVLEGRTPASTPPKPAPDPEPAGEPDAPKIRRPSRKSRAMAGLTRP